MKHQLNNLEKLLPQCMGADRILFSKRLRGIGKLALHKREHAVAKLANAMHESVTERETRLARKTVISYPEELPVCERRDEISAAIDKNQVVIVCGETGSGKTTQIPKICLDLGRGIDGLIGHTQPRRIAARTIAGRIAEELNTTPGHYVGYKIRHTDRTTRETCIKLMTDGILLAELQADRGLYAYDTLIIDEAHERSLNIDFLLGYIKRLLPKRPELKVIITSATIDVHRFSSHFDDAPVIEVSGRTWPVEVRYRPINEDDDAGSGSRETAVLEAINELSLEGRGDILVFLEGEGEIHEMLKFLRRQKLPDTDILSLYARLGTARQNRIFMPHRQRHIVLATNIAETSLTIPGIHYVIDAGVARISRYSHRSKVQRLPIEKISHASAEQRKGRCGRTSNGVCIRLYEESDFELRQRFSDAEILRTNLSSVILQMMALKLGDIQDFPFLDMPDKRYINDGIRLLKEIGALNRYNALTCIGKNLVRLPLDPRLGRIVLAANESGCLAEALIIASALSIQDPRERPLEARVSADAAHAKFNGEHSDFLWFLNFWRFSQEQSGRVSRNRLRKICKQNYISYVRVREWIDIHDQLREICSDMGMKINPEPAGYSEIHCAILSGMASHVAQKTETNEYNGARNNKLYIFPGSSQFQKKPKWIVAAELMETSRLYACTVARIDPEWLLKIAGHLLKKNYFDPSWDKRNRRVRAFERVTLYGLIVTGRRVVNYGVIDPEESRKIFIRTGLVEEEYETSDSFYIHNRNVIEQLKLLEKKSRRMDILDEDAIYRFYDRHVPAQVHDGNSFEKWYRQAVTSNRRLLFLEQDDIMLHAAETVTATNYPDCLLCGDVSLPLAYEFRPGEDMDGVTIKIPLQMLNQIDANQCEYLVPGLLEEKIQYLIKSLPKQIRKTLVPISETALECARGITNGAGALTENIANFLHRTAGIKIPANAWKSEGLPPHLLMNFCIVDDAGSILDTDRDLEKLRSRLGKRAETRFSDTQSADYYRDGIKRWDFGELCESITAITGGASVPGYPALIDNVDTVALRLLDTPEKAVAKTRAGLRRLFMLELEKEMKYLRKNLPEMVKMGLLYSGIGSKDELTEDILHVITDQVFLDGRPLIRTESEFMHRKQEGVGDLLLQGNLLCAIVYEVLVKANRLRTILTEKVPVASVISSNDIREHLDTLVYNGFVRQTPVKWLRCYPRYLEAIERRIEKLQYSQRRDEEKTAELRPYWEYFMGYIRKNRQQDNPHPEVDTYHWMLEEYRVSVFAQDLKTVFPVSLKRIEKQRQRIRELLQTGEK